MPENKEENQDIGKHVNDYEGQTLERSGQLDYVCGLRKELLGPEIAATESPRSTISTC